MGPVKKKVCRLDKLKNLKILREILGVSAAEWQILTQRGDSNFRTREIPKDDGTMRELEIPKDRLKRIHSRIHHQLSLLPTPDYLHSGVKGRSSLTNGRAHEDAKSALTLDIKKFYPSCSASAVFEFFRYRLQQPRDIAEGLVSVVTYGGHIPTGSPLSQGLAYWSKAPAFDEIYRYAVNRGLKMSLYVDDITLSSTTPKIPGHTFTDVAGILKRYQLRAKQNKTHFYGAQASKRITGNILQPDGTIVAPNKLREKLFREFIAPVGGDVSRLPESKARSALGVLRTIRTVERKPTYPGLYCKLVNHERLCAELAAANSLAASLGRQSSAVGLPIDREAGF